MSELSPFEPLVPDEALFFTSEQYKLISAFLSGVLSTSESTQFSIDLPDERYSAVGYGNRLAIRRDGVNTPSLNAKFTIGNSSTPTDKENPLLINGIETSYCIEGDLDPDVINLAGSIHNNSIRHELDDRLDPKEYPDSPISNISGVLAPWEEALCQSIADIRRCKVIRSVSTSASPTSRFVQNYYRRGFRDEPDEIWQELGYDVPFVDVYKEYLPQEPDQQI